jgi:penicillin-binding protein 2
MRIKIIRIVIGIAFVLLVINLFYIQVIRGGYYFRLSTNNRVRMIPLEAARGRILDRNGVILADNRVAYNLQVIPAQSGKNLDDLFSAVGAVLDMTPQTLQKKYLNRKSNPFTPVMVAQDIPRAQAMVLEELRFRFPNLVIEETYRRQYPLQSAAAHVVGYVGKPSPQEVEDFKEYGYSQDTFVGKSGIEQYYDELLRGKPGGLQIEVNSRGYQVRLLSFLNPLQGEDLVLTIDYAVQQAATEFLNGRRGAAVVMDMDSGEVLGLVSSPAFDPNVFVDKSRAEETREVFNNTNSPLLNRVVNAAFPPGSVFKIPVAIAGLVHKKITPHTSFQCHGALSLGATRFNCSHTHGLQDLFEAIAHSCNVYFFHIGQIIGEETIGRYAKLLGLGKRTKIDLSFEKEGYIPSRLQPLLTKRQSWYTGDTLNFSIGQGDVLATPIQLARMMAVVARDGKAIRPHILKAYKNERVIFAFSQRELNLDKSIFEYVQRGLRETITDPDGTAHLLNIAGMYVAGKTGTAQSVPGKDHHAWFAGYVKSDKRNISFCVLLEYGGSSANAVAITRDLLLALQQDEII